MSILVFDSGLGGLSILRELRLSMPDASLVYVADTAGFPYGDWQEDRLTDHLLALFERLIVTHRPQLVVIACNTATTIAIGSLRERFGSTPFVGTVPAIKPAAERTASGLISVLATPGTIDRAYTRDLIARFAADKWVTLVGAPDLAQFAENHLRGDEVDMDQLRQQIEPCFVERDGRRTDIVVLGCTHYPFLANQMRKTAPWPVDWLDPAEAIAKRVREVTGGTLEASEAREDQAVFTSDMRDEKVLRLVRSFGLQPQTV
jgi:glutamate racemase